MPAKVFLFLYNYVFPFLGFPWVTWLWLRAGGGSLACLVMGVPLVYGYVIPGIGTNLMKKWRFKGHLLMGRYFIHHGFIYSSTMGLSLYMAMYPWAEGAWSPVLVVLRNAAITGFVAWWHDIMAVRAGMVEIYNSPWERGAAPEVIVTHYAPVCFSLLGATYAVMGLAARPLALAGDGRIWWLFPAGLAGLSAATCLPYLALEKR